MRLGAALRGRGSASPAASAGAVAAKGRPVPLALVQLPLDEVRPNPRQPRQFTDPEALKELAASITEHGLLQPVLVRRVDGGYEVVAGHRRLQAAQAAGMRSIPAVVVDASDVDSALLALVENLQRKDLGFVEEARAYERVLREFGLTQDELARRVGKGQSTVANKLRVLRLADEALLALVAAGATERHARALLGLRSPQAQLAAAQAIASRGLSVRQTEELVERQAAAEQAKGGPAGASGGRRPGQRWRVAFRDVRILSNTFRQAVARIREAGLEADLTEEELDEGLAIRVVVRLPAGWNRGRRPGGAGAAAGGGRGAR